MLFRSRFPLAGLLKLACLAKSTFYYQVTAQQTADKYWALKEQIKAIYDRHKGRYGYRRVHDALLRAQKIKPARGGLSLADWNDQALRRRAAMPAKPSPRRASEAGSGTSPLVAENAALKAASPKPHSVQSHCRVVSAPKSRLLLK